MLCSIKDIPSDIVQEITTQATQSGPLSEVNWITLSSRWASENTAIPSPQEPWFTSTNGLTETHTINHLAELQDGSDLKIPSPQWYRYIAYILSMTLSSIILEGRCNPSPPFRMKTCINSYQD